MMGLKILSDVVQKMQKFIILSLFWIFKASLGNLLAGGLFDFISVFQIFDSFME